MDLGTLSKIVEDQASLFWSYQGKGDMN
uniref:Uncharacterized protein n=1 Tax=Rhizophora mucronata TaxID=61149 RepID=A0A2P2P795_RHIMU